MAKVMGCFPHCALEDAKEMYENALSLFERPGTTAGAAATMHEQEMYVPVLRQGLAISFPSDTDVSSGKRPWFSKVSSSDLVGVSSPGYAPASRSVIMVWSNEDGSSNISGRPIPQLFYSPAILPDYAPSSDD